MKTETLFASILLSLLTCLPVALAAPTPVGGYSLLPESPLPGISGVHFDKENKVVNAHYGDNDMEKHMEHLIYNERKHPENKRVFRPGPRNKTGNRKKAMSNTDLPSLRGFARDEKPLNAAVHKGKTTTIRYVPREESDREKLLMGRTFRKARKERVGIQLHANPGPNYHGRGERSLSPQSAPGVKTGTSSRAPWNAGPGSQRPDSAGPYPKGRAPESRSKLVPKATIEQLKDGIPTRGRSPGPVQVAGPSKQRAREPSSSSSRSSSRDHSPGAPESPRSPTPDTKGKGKGPAASSKPAWNAGPGAQAAVRKSSRIAKLPPVKYKT